jgi:hypothetical protein
MKQIVLLGASNLTVGFPIVADRIAAGWGPGPYRLLAAAGHGRAYALSSRVVGRSLPAIADCGLWRELDSVPALPTRALVADAGNDLAYGARVDETVEAVEGCLARLRAAGAEIILVLPPLAAIERLTRTRFLVTRSILFPGRRFGLGAILSRLRRLAAELRRLASTSGAQAVEPEPGWLCGDGIHIRLAQRQAAWSSLLGGWRREAAASGLPSRIRWSSLRAEKVRLLAVPIRNTQPAKQLGDGSTAAFY